MKVYLGVALLLLCPSAPIPVSEPQQSRPQQGGASRPATPAAAPKPRIARYAARADGRRRLGDPAASAIASGLEWLKGHQEPDGSWSGRDYPKLCPEQDRCTGLSAGPHLDVGLTGLALLSFLADGSSTTDGLFRESVQKGIAWLRTMQRRDGSFGYTEIHERMYCHAIATLAVCEAFGMSGDAGLRASAESAVQFIEQSRNPGKVWRYYPRDGNNDTSLTGWMVYALVAAQDAGVTVSKQVLADALRWLDHVTVPETGQACYSQPGEGSARKQEAAARFPSKKTEALTGVALHCRFLLGQTPKRTPIMAKAAEAILRRPPVWNPNDGSIDIYYWFHASCAMFQMGGAHWTEWSKKLQETLVGSQNAKGHAKGSWDPVDAWSDDGGRIYATAMAVLSLQAPYRLARATTK